MIVSADLSKEDMWLRGCPYIYTEHELTTSMESGLKLYVHVFYFINLDILFEKVFALQSRYKVASVRVFIDECEHHRNQLLLRFED